MQDTCDQQQFRSPGVPPHNRINFPGKKLTLKQQSLQCQQIAGTFSPVQMSPRGDDTRTVSTNDYCSGQQLNQKMQHQSIVTAGAGAPQTSSNNQNENRVGSCISNKPKTTKNTVEHQYYQQHNNGMNQNGQELASNVQLAQQVMNKNSNGSPRQLSPNKRIRNTNNNIAVREKYQQKQQQQDQPLKNEVAELMETKQFTETFLNSIVHGQDYQPQQQHNNNNNKNCSVNNGAAIKVSNVGQQQHQYLNHKQRETTISSQEQHDLIDSQQKMAATPNRQGYSPPQKQNWQSIQRANAAPAPPFGFSKGKNLHQAMKPIPDDHINMIEDDSYNSQQLGQPQGPSSAPTMNSCNVKASSNLLTPSFAGNECSKKHQLTKPPSQPVPSDQMLPKVAHTSNPGRSKQINPRQTCYNPNSINNLNNGTNNTNGSVLQKAVGSSSNRQENNTNNNTNNNIMRIGANSASNCNTGANNSKHQYTEKKSYHQQQQHNAMNQSMYFSDHKKNQQQQQQYNQNQQFQEMRASFGGKINKSGLANSHEQCEFADSIMQSGEKKLPVQHQYMNSMGDYNQRVTSEYQQKHLMSPEVVNRNNHNHQYLNSSSNPKANLINLHHLLMASPPSHRQNQNEANTSICASGSDLKMMFQTDDPSGFNLDTSATQEFEMASPNPKPQMYKNSHFQTSQKKQPYYFQQENADLIQLNSSRDTAVGVYPIGDFSNLSLESLRINNSLITANPNVQQNNATEVYNTSAVKKKGGQTQNTKSATHNKKKQKQQLTEAQPSNSGVLRVSINKEQQEVKSQNQNLQDQQKQSQQLNSHEPATKRQLKGHLLPPAGPPSAPNSDAKFTLPTIIPSKQSAGQNKNLSSGEGLSKAIWKNSSFKQNPQSIINSVGNNNVVVNTSNASLNARQLKPLLNQNQQTANSNNNNVNKMPNESDLSNFNEQPVSQRNLAPRSKKNSVAKEQSASQAVLQAMQRQYQEQSFEFTFGDCQDPSADQSIPASQLKQQSVVAGHPVITTGQVPLKEITHRFKQQNNNNGAAINNGGSHQICKQQAAPFSYNNGSILTSNQQIPTNNGVDHLYHYNNNFKIQHSELKLRQQHSNPQLNVKQQSNQQPRQRNNLQNRVQRKHLNADLENNIDAATTGNGEIMILDSAGDLGKSRDNNTNCFYEDFAPPDELLENGTPFGQHHYRSVLNTNGTNLQVSNLAFQATGVFNNLNNNAVGVCNSSRGYQNQSSLVVASNSGEVNLQQLRSSTSNMTPLSPPTVPNLPNLLMLESRMFPGSQ